MQEHEWHLWLQLGTELQNAMLRCGRPSGARGTGGVRVTTEGEWAGGLPPESLHTRCEFPHELR